jgi:serine/threonine protein phosphatase PrpC
MRILQFLRNCFKRKQPIPIEPADYVEPSSFTSHGCSDLGGSRTTSNTVSYEHAEIDLPEKGIRFGYYFLAEGFGSYDRSQFTPDAFVMKSITETLLDAPIEILAQRYAQLNEKECESAIEVAFQKASKELNAIAAETAMATFTGALIRGRSISFGHVGANRLYWVDRNKIYQLTREHLLWPRMLLYGCLGSIGLLIPDDNLLVSTLNDIDDGYLLLCSWRLWESIGEAELRDVVMTSSSLENACTSLLKSASDSLDERRMAMIIASNPKYKT